MSRPIYKIKHSIVRKKDVYEILRPDGSIVNETSFNEEKHALKKLNTLIALGYCKGEKNES